MNRFVYIYIHLFIAYSLYIHSSDSICVHFAIHFTCVQDGLDPNTDITVHLTTGSPELLVNITGLQALDRQIPAEIHFNVLGRQIHRRGLGRERVGKPPAEADSVGFLSFVVFLMFFRCWLLLGEFFFVSCFCWEHMLVIERDEMSAFVGVFFTQ